MISVYGISKQIIKFLSKENYLLKAIVLSLRFFATVLIIHFVLENIKNKPLTINILKIILKNFMVYFLFSFIPVLLLKN